MEVNIIVSKLKKIIRDNLNYDVQDENKNLFDEFAAYDLLYIIDSIESTFGITIGNIINNCDHSIMSVNNLAQRISKCRNDKNGNN